MSLFPEVTSYLGHGSNLPYTSISMGHVKPLITQSSMKVFESKAYDFPDPNLIVFKKIIGFGGLVTIFNMF